jgi:hypothetical protein
MSEYQFTPQAADDLFEIWSYIAMTKHVTRRGAQLSNLTMAVLPCGRLRQVRALVFLILLSAA